MEKLIAGYLFLVVSIWLFWRAIKYLKLVRIIEDTPRSNVASSSQGMVELKGKTLPLENQVLMVPRKNIPCVWYRYVKTDEYSDNQYSKSEIKESHNRFYIEDHTGRCAIDPIHAEVHAKREYDEYQDGEKHEVSWIGVDESIYVLGWMDTLHPASKTDDVITVRANKEHRYGQLTDKLERITKPPHNWLPFIISTHFEYKLVRRYRSLFFAWLIGGIILLISGGIFIKY